MTAWLSPDFFVVVVVEDDWDVVVLVVPVSGSSAGTMPEDDSSGTLASLETPELSGAEAPDSLPIVASQAVLNKPIRQTAERIDKVRLIFMPIPSFYSVMAFFFRTTMAAAATARIEAATVMGAAETPVSGDTLLSSSVVVPG